MRGRSESGLASQEGADAVEEGIGAVTCFTPVLLVELQSYIVIGVGAQVGHVANLTTTFRFDKVGHYDMKAEHAPDPGVALGTDVVNVEHSLSGVENGVV